MRKSRNTSTVRRQWRLPEILLSEVWLVTEKSLMYGTFEIELNYHTLSGLPPDVLDRTT